MSQSAHLITPDGKNIELPAEVYLQVKRLLATRNPKRKARSRSQINSILHASYGMLAGNDSLTESLLAERKADYNREEARIKHSKG
jgi:hypothetical protein